jgi:uncharacterized membrane protein YuzA (DUF378 family)
MRTIDIVAGILLLIGGINWGLIGLFDFNVVTFLFGASVLTKLTYILVGASALWGLYRCKLGHCCHHE